MISTLKQRLYDIIANQLNVTVRDNPYDPNETEGIFPYALLKVHNANHTFYKNCNERSVEFKIDIFSNYNGEKEILIFEEHLISAIKALLTVDNVMDVAEKSFQIIDDKMRGVQKKHGIIILKFLCDINTKGENDD